MTGQAFLLTIALGPGSSHVARYISSFLSFVAAVTSLILMGGHRRSEFADAAWLKKFETRVAPNSVVHGKKFSKRRRAEKLKGVWRIFEVDSSFPWWMGGIAVFGVAGMAAFFITAFAPNLL